jgi:hypothetical protein
MPEPDHLHRAGVSAAGQSLEMKPAAPAAVAEFEENPPGAGDQ